MTIAIPGYETIFKNEVYSRAEVIHASDGSDAFTVRHVLLPRRFTEQSEEDVVNYLQRKTSDLRGVRVLQLPNGQIACSDRSELEIAILALPDSVRNYIITGDDNYLKFIRQNTLARNIEEEKSPAKLVSIRYGIIPAGTIEHNENDGQIDSSKWYDFAFNHKELRKRGLGERFTIRITLEEGALPSRQEADILVNHGTYRSNTFDVSAPYNPKMMRPIVDAIYSALPEVFAIGQLTDVSSDKLEELSLQPILALHAMLEDEQKEREKAETERKAMQSKMRGILPFGDFA